MPEDSPPTPWSRHIWMPPIFFMPRPPRDHPLLGATSVGLAISIPSHQVGFITLIKVGFIFRAKPTSIPFGCGIPVSKLGFGPTNPFFHMFTAMILARGSILPPLATPNSITITPLNPGRLNERPSREYIFPFEPWSIPHGSENFQLFLCQEFAIKSCSY